MIFRCAGTRDKVHKPVYHTEIQHGKDDRKAGNGHPDAETLLAEIRQRERHRQEDYGETWRRADCIERDGPRGAQISVPVASFRATDAKR